MKRLLISLIIIILIIGAAGFFGYNWYNNQIFSAFNNEGELSSFKVNQGESTNSIATRLEQEGYISNANALLLYLRLNSLGGNIKAGEFKVSSSMTAEEIINTLSESPSFPTAWIQIKEGLRYDEVLSDLQDQLIEEDIFLSRDKMTEIVENPHAYYDEFSLETKEFLQTNLPKDATLEGFLFPDTYNIDVQITEVQIIDLLVSTLRERLIESNINESNTSRSVYEIINVASMLEREANTSPDYEIVAGIIYNRLDDGETLGIDATLLYYFKDWKHELKRSELDDPSNPYNTRKLTGLPPTPISNPGLATIIAAANPEETTYRFYLTGSDGKMYYAETYAGHQANYKYL